jgi:hypothetical protein
MATNIASIPAGITDFIESWERYRAGYSRNSVRRAGTKPNATRPKIK